MGSAGVALMRLLPLLLALLGPGSSEDVNVLVGKTVQLKVIYSGKATGYTWTKASTRVADWDEHQDVTYYETLKGRCELNTSTGILTIRELKEEDSASYKGEAVVNNIYESSNYDLRVYPSLKKPIVTCSVLSGNYTLRCNHQPEPPTYTWRNNGVLVTATDPNYLLSNVNKSLTLTHAKAPFQSLECVVQNPASTNSAPVPLECFEGLINNEEQKTHRRYGLIIFAVIASIVILAVTIGFLVFKRTRENQTTPRGGVDDKSEEQRSLTQNESTCHGPGNNVPQSGRGEGGNADDPDQTHLHQDESTCQEPGNNVPQSGRGEGGNADDPDQTHLHQVSDPKNDEKEDDGERVNHRSSSQHSISSGDKRDETSDTKV